MHLFVVCYEEPTLRKKFGSDYEEYCRNVRRWWPRYFPPKHGFRFGFFTIPPDMQTNIGQIGTAAGVEELQQKLPGMMEVLEIDHPGMHTTDTVDFDVVISGEVYLELDDGTEVHLNAGDCVIQNGTRHAWHNRAAEKCVIAVTLVGAERKR